MRTLPPFVAVVVVADVVVELEEVDAVLVAVATAAEGVLEVFFFLGMGEEATRVRRERDRMVDEKCMSAVSC